MNSQITESLATHIVSVYNTMEGESVELDDLKIYTGSLAGLISGLGISMTYYKPIFRALYDNGYCALGDRGGRDKPSTVVLLRRPEKDELKSLTTTEGEPIVSLVNRIEALETSTGGMLITKALQEIETRLKALEERL